PPRSGSQVNLLAAPPLQCNVTGGQTCALPLVMRRLLDLGWQPAQVVLGGDDRKSVVAGQSVMGRV
ncbi:hypothetical protein ABTB34_21505, partial [Acinetobacter baumannii]